MTQPNTRMQATTQLAGKNTGQSRFPRKPAQKSRIIQTFFAPAMLGAPDAQAVGWLLLVRNPLLPSCSGG
jgi:hypothetical protein